VTNIGKRRENKTNQWNGRLCKYPEKRKREGPLLLSHQSKRKKGEGVYDPHDGFPENGKRRIRTKRRRKRRENCNLIRALN